MLNGNQQYLAPSRESSFGLSKLELEDRILYDDDSVFERLGINLNPGRAARGDLDFIAACANSVREKCGKEIKTLRKLCRRAERRSESVLEDEVWEDPTNWRGRTSVNHRSREEKRMYEPLSFLFSHIANFTQPGRPHEAPQRVFKLTNSLVKAEEPHTFGVASVSPAFTGLKNTAAPESQIWSDREMFAEVKPSSKQGPKASEDPDSRIRPIVGQCASYARLLMTARPFMLFCTGLLIFGTKFCVGLFDREGIIFSPIHDMFDDLDVFVNVVHTLTRKASITQLGFDPSVELLSIQRTRELTGDSISRTFLKSRKIRRLDHYPSALVSLRTDVGELYRWCTIGYPIWSSESLFGRGTNVWHVRLYQDNALEGPVMVLKTSWRNSGRMCESEIYGHLSDRLVSIPGLAKFECGGDVVFPDSTRVISVQTLRTQLDIFSGQPTPTLHRLVLKSVGRPMWEYDSDYQLLRAFRDVIRAHQSMCNQGILHRDISPGNMLLTIDETDDIHGVLCDLELARISTPMMSSAESIPGAEVVNDSDTRFDPPSRVNRGAPMTGTAQFMARALLMRNAKKHEAEHDIESFIWAFSFCVLRKLWQCILDYEDTIPEIKHQKEEFLTLYNPLFTQTEPKIIASYRTPMSYIIIFVDVRDIKDIVETFISEPLITLFRRFGWMIYDSQPPYGRTPSSLTHDALLLAIDEAIFSF